MSGLPKSIFKAYDIRGIVQTELTPENVRDIGQAIGSEAMELGISSIVIARDGRLSGPVLSESLTNGILASGVNVIDIGMVPTPMLYFATHLLQTGSGIMVTGSHNPPEYNGLKMMLAGDTLSGDRIQGLYRRIAANRLTQGAGTLYHQDINDAYENRISQDIRLARPLHIIIDCGNGVAGAFAGNLYRSLGAEVTEIFCEVDGHFPNHHPDPSKPENLRDLAEAVTESGADIGLAFDGDGDRLGVVTSTGKIIYADRLLMLFAKDLLSRKPGATVLFDVKSTRNLSPWIRHHGGDSEMCKTGHSFIKARMKETGAELAGEMSGHFFFKERWYGFDDGLYAGCRLLEILSLSNDAETIFNTLPDAVSTPEINIPMLEGEPSKFIRKLQDKAVFPGANDICTLDGLRVEYPDGFGLIRASNTTPVLVLRFEADSLSALTEIQDSFRAVMAQFSPDKELVF
ncbi:MAG TPA: phosphomannomutase/phosphoglucomutase [Burkholderiales bacterium]|nr:phosphomannomutase/phosphoglucomutase [Burkholderiales bacterium]